MPPVIQRRHIVRGLSALSLAAVATTPSGPAAAFRLLSPGEAKGLLDEGCGATAYHRRLIDEAVRAAGLTLTDREREVLLARLSCPTCRCPLGMFDDPVTGPRF